MREEGRGKTQWRVGGIKALNGRRVEELVHASSLQFFIASPRHRNFFSTTLLISLKRASDSPLNTCSLSERADLIFSSFRFARLILTFIPAPSIQACTARRPTPTSEIEAGLPLAAISAKRSYAFDAVCIIRSGTSAASLLPACIAAVRADLSLAEPLGNANAAMTLLKAAVSSSTSKSISSFSCCAFTAQSLKYLSLSSQPRFPADKLATIPPREAPNAPINAATEPPSGAGESLRVSLQNRRRSNFTIDFFGTAASIFSSIIFSFGSNGFNSLNPMERIASSI